jgi:hypothetical protein
MLQPSVRVRLNRDILHRKLLSPRPPHHRFRHFDTLFIRERDREREDFPWSHGQVTGKSPAGRGEIPDRALTLEWSSVVRDSALHGEATVGTKRKGHESSP